MPRTPTDLLDRPENENASARLLSQQQRLLSAVVHELQNGLQGLMAQGDRLVFETSRRVPDLGAIAKLGEEMLALTQMLNEVTKNLQSGLSPRSLRPIDAARIVRRVAGFMAPKAKSLGVGIQVLGGDETWMVMASEPVLQQVVFNLVDNAIKYSHRVAPKASPVRVVLRRAGDQMEVEVQSFGLPIGPDEMERIFEPYYRGKAAMEQSPLGMGLGLFVSRNLLKEQGGSLRIYSKPIRDGQALTTAIARLPFAQEAARLAAK